MRVHIIWGGGIVLAAYVEEAADSAELHARVITGAMMTTVELLDRVPKAILDDVGTEFEGASDEDTPITPRTLTVEDLDDPEREG